MIGDAIAVGAPALIVLTLVRISLLVRAPVGDKLKHPSKVPGLPMAGPASAAAAHAAIMRRRARPWWKLLGGR
jgi:hypothetical protein